MEEEYLANGSPMLNFGAFRGHNDQTFDEEKKSNQKLKETLIISLLEWFRILLMVANSASLDFMDSLNYG